MIKKYWKNIVSFILIFALLLQIYPTPAYAEDDLPADLECEPQTGMSALYEHAPFEAGMAGTAYLNYYLGTLHFRRNDISLGGMRMPVAIEFYHDAANDAGSNPYGALWATSYNQLLRYNAQSELYAYKNENGTWIYFRASDELDADGNEIWVEDVEYGVGEIGLELRIPEAAERTNYTDVDLIYGDVHYAFDSEGRLIAITDGVNRIEVAYVPNAVQSIACITDPVGREYRFSYVDGYLAAIHCYSAENTVIANMSVSYNIVNGQLAEVTYASGDKITYEYNTNHAITKAVNIDLCGYLFEYVADTNQISAVTAKAAMGTAQETAGMVTTVTYPVEGQTVITTEDTQQRYTFDGCGRVTNCELLMATTAPAALDPVAQQYQCVYGYTLTYGYVTGDNGAIINTVTDTQVYDADGTIEEPSEDETEQPSEDETEPEVTEPDNYEYTEDAYGNILTESYVENGLRQTTTYTYTADGNFLMSQTDPDGHTVQYQYNLNSGMLESLTDANGNETEYTYNALRELQNVHIDVSGLTDDTGMEASYSYAQGRLSELTYGDFSYEFTYDIWGNIITVAMNDAPLVNYDYGTAAHKGQVQTLTYGNGQKVFYAYNALGQVTSVGYTDQLGRFQYSYAADGALASIYDSIMQETTVYSESGYEIRSASGTVIYSYAADEDGNETESINGLTFQTVFTDSGITLRCGGASILSASKVYDAFSRISSKTVTAGALQI